MATRKSSRAKAAKPADELRGPPLAVARSLYTQPARLEELDYPRQLDSLARSLEFLMNDF